MFGFGSSNKRKKKQSLFRRILYFVVLLSSSGSFGGWALKDHPQIRTLISLVTGEDPESIEAVDAFTAKKKLASAVVEAIKTTRHEFSSPGVYQVAIPRVTLDPASFREGNTIDIQTKVVKLDPRGRDVTIWESKPFGERLAVVGEDELTAGWPHRQFQVPWSPGDQIVVEVYDRRGGIFVQPRRFVLAPPGPDSRDFPLRSGTFALIPMGAADLAQEARRNRIDFVSSRIGDLDQNHSTQMAERPIVIK